MQQFPEQQPDASSSGIIQPEQMQVDAPLYRSPESDEQVRDIVLYPNRKKIIGYFALLAGTSLFMILATIFIVSLIFLASPLEITQKAAIIPPLVGFFTGLACFFGWFAWEMISLIYPESKPALIINSEGIIVGKMPFQGGYFILWSEIETVFTSSYYIHEYLCILPKNTNQFMSRFHPLERFFRRLNAKVGSPLYIPLDYTDVSASEIMDRIRTLSRP